MDLTTTGFLFLIVVVSGVIAVIADNLGRKVGKKRLHFYHIRPRHIANMAVAASGVMVSFFTIMIVAALSQDVRTWITDGRHAIVEAKNLRENVETLKTDTKRLETTNSDLEKMVRTNADAVRRLRLERGKQTIALASLKTDVTRLTATLRESTTRIRDLDRKLAGSQKDLAQRREELQRAQTQLAETNRQIRLATRDRNLATQEYNSINRRNLELVGQVDNLEKDVRNLDKTVRELMSTRADLEEKRIAAEADLKKSSEELAVTRQDLTTITTQLAAIRQDYQQAQQFNQLVGSTFSRVRQEPITYRIGDELVRMPVDPNLNGNQANQAVQTFLSMARTSAIARGAKGNTNYSAADIVDRVGATGTDSIPAATIKRELASRLQASSQPLVLIGYSSLNAFAGEPVSMEISVLPNPVVYKAGETIAETDIAANRSTSDIFNQISDFITKKVRGRLERDGMIAKVGSDTPYGSVTANEILSLVDELKKEDRRVNLRANVVNETHAGDVIKLSFKLR